MDELTPYKKSRTARKSTDGAGIVAISISLAPLVSSHVPGLPEGVAATAIGFILGGLRNVLKHRAPRWFGWL